MRLFIYATLVFVTTSSFTVHAQPARKRDPFLEQGRRALAILEQRSDWETLFNGENLEGWTGDLNGYSAEEGRLVCQKGGKNLVTERQFGDFAFQFEFKLEASGNNGIGIRVPKGGHPSSSGMEIQILDHFGDRYQGIAEIEGGRTRKMSWLKPWQYHGSIYGIVPARTGYLKPVGEWNQQTIVAIDDHIMVILNGAVIVDAFLDDAVALDGGSHPGMKNQQGHLVLAGHNDRVEFRELRILDYAASPPKPKSSADNTPPTGFTALFNGLDLEGWKGLAHKNANQRRTLGGPKLAAAQAKANQQMRDHWRVIDGVLTYDGQGQSLCTAKEFGDFELYVDWKIPPGADSGIYLRGTPQVQIWDPWDAKLAASRSEGNDDRLASGEWLQSFKNGRNLGSGGLWNNRRWRNSPLVMADRRPGNWNTFLIRMVGDRVTIWLNEKQVVDRVKLENYWDKSGRVPLARRDQIELQHHGSELFFKNIYLRELPY